MLRILLASTATLAISASGVFAACVEDPEGVFLCSGEVATPISDARDAVVVEVAPGAALTAPTRPVELGGAGSLVVNGGLIEATSSANGTYAIVSTGADLAIANDGRIASGDRGIEVLGGDGGLLVLNGPDGEIASRRQTIRSGENFPNATIINEGLIESQNGRAAQLRGAGATVINHGTMIGGEEVIEGRLDFTLLNTGEIRIREGVTGEDGVQFASGFVENFGLIEGSDDGVDIDEGLIVNRAGGRIVSTARGDVDSAAIDADPVLQDPSLPAAQHPQAGLLTIVNEGLIEGGTAIAADRARTGAFEIINSGSIVGLDGAAIVMAPGMEASTLSLFGDSMILGDVLFGGGDDLLVIGAITSGVLINSVFDGGAGDNTVAFDGYGLGDLLRFDAGADLVSLALLAGDGSVLTGAFRNFGFWEIAEVRYTTAELANAVAPIPLPAAGWLLLAGVGGLLALRRRAA